MEKIQAIFIFEILGRPPEHIKEALKSLIKKLGEEKGVNLINQTYNEVIKVEDVKNLYTTFAEIESEFDSLEILYDIMFRYMPANVEIISPTSLKISNRDLSELATNLIRRLHDYDSIAKSLINERDALTKKLQEVAPHLFNKEKQNLYTNNDKVSKRNSPRGNRISSKKN